MSMVIKMDDLSQKHLVEKMILQFAIKLLDIDRHVFYIKMIIDIFII